MRKLDWRSVVALLALLIIICGATGTSGPYGAAWLLIQEQAGGTGTPDSGLASIYAKDDGTLHFINDAGTDTTILGTGTGAASGANSDITSLSGLTGGISTPTSITLANNGTIDAGTGVGNTYSLRARATTGGTWINLITATNAALAPTLDFPTGFTWNGGAVPITAGGTGQTTAAAAINALGASPAPGAFQTFLPKNGSTNTALASGTSVCTYLGKAPRTASSWKVLMYQGTAGAAPTSWAEVALCSGGAPVSATNQSLTTAGYVDISGWIGGATGPRLLTISASFTAGDHMWLVIGENTTTRANVRSVTADEMDGGLVGSAAARPSTMGAGTAFTKSTTLAGPYAIVYPN